LSNICVRCLWSLGFISRGASGYGNYVVKLKKRGSKKRRCPVLEGVRQRTGGSVSGALLIVPAVVCLLIACQTPVAQGGPPVISRPYGYFDFPTCVRYALVHSDDLTRSRIEVQLKSIDLKDAHSELLPTLELVTRYYLTRTDETSDNRLNVNVTMTNFNPYQALLKMKAMGILVDIARESHRERISDGVRKIAKMFFKVSKTEKLIRARKMMAALLRKKVEYGKSRRAQGGLDPVQVRMWNNSLRGEELVVRSLENQREEFIGQLKMFLGYHPDYYLPVDTRDAIEQLLSGFNGRLLTFADIQAANQRLKIIAKQEQVQSVRVQGAYVAILPRPVFVFESLSNQVDRASGFNLAIGFDHTLWDGFRRIRDIKRQKLMTRDYYLQRKEMSRQLYTDYRRLMRQLDISAEREAFNRERERLAEVTEERALDRYKSGDLNYADYIDTRMQRVEAHLSFIEGLEDRVFALIELATMAGGLNRYNARVQY
jgi:outer membrane protein TolC